MIEDSAPVLLLTQGQYQTRWSEIAATLESSAVGGTDVVRLDADWPKIDLHDGTALLSGVKAENLAYVIYTSGSTGEPKGSEVPHRSIPGFIFGIDYVSFDQETVLLQHSSVSWDALTLELWPPLLKGGKCLLSHEPVLTAADVKNYVQKGANTLWLTAALFNSVAETDLRCFQGVRSLMTGGETVPIAQLKRVKEQFPEIQLVNGYGPSECSVFSNCYVVPERLGEDTRTGLIGKPIGDRRVYVLEASMEPAPPGVRGEICIGGPSVARGYVNRSSLTAERFVADPFAHEPGTRLYRTGDFGRWLTDGTLEFAGRNDFQVKIRGFRIELGEIEARLAEHPSIHEAVVVAREAGAGNTHLVAYYTLKADARLETRDLRSFLANVLPGHMIPAAYVQLDSFPLTPNGKLNRNALPVPGEDAFLMRDYEPPVGDQEVLVAKIWANVLGFEQVGREDNFFELGGTSLLAVKVANLMEQANAPVLAASIFMYPTVKSLARQIGTSGQSAQSNAAVCFRAGTSGPPLFLAPSGIGQLLYVPTLLPHLSDDIPVYGLPPLPLGEATSFTVEQMAARMVKMIREVQPAGPYRVAGWSFGGILAYEIAGQLLGADQKIEFLGLFDTYYSGGGTQDSPEATTEWDDCKTLLARIEFYLSIGQRPPLSQKPLDEAMEWLRSNVARTDIATFVRRCREFSLMPKTYSHLTVVQLRQTFARERAHILANLRYYAQPLPIPVHLFIARENALSPREAWTTAVPAGLLRAIEISGNHQSMMKSPNIEVFGDAVSHAIETAVRNPVSIPEANYFPLTPLQVGRANVPPLFCIPGAGANVTSFTELVTSLNRTQPVYGLQPRGLEDGLLPHSTVQASAECFMEVINQTFPEGPVHLLGHSFGGWIAFHMAQEMSKRGRVIASVTVLDSEVPDSPETAAREYSNTEVIMKWASTFELILGRPLGIQRSDIDMRPERVQRKLLHERLIAHGLLPSRTAPDVLQGPLRTFAAALRAHFTPKEPYGGALRLALVDDPTLDEAANRRNRQHLLRGWQLWAPHLDCIHAPGNHLTVLKSPHAKMLAKWVMEDLSGRVHKGREANA